MFKLTGDGVSLQAWKSISLNELLSSCLRAFIFSMFASAAQGRVSCCDRTLKSFGTSPTTRQEGALPFLRGWCLQTTLPVTVSADEFETPYSSSSDSLLLPKRSEVEIQDHQLPAKFFSVRDTIRCSYPP